VFEIRYARMPEDRPVPMDTAGANGTGPTYDQSSVASDSESETTGSSAAAGAAGLAESVRERRLRELQLQVARTHAQMCSTH